MANKYPDNDWMLARLGKFTSSKIGPLFVGGTDKLSVGAITYVKEVATEILTGTQRELKVYALDWGNENEPKAAELLAEKHEGFEYHGGDNKLFIPYTEFSGGSPDATIKFPGKVVFEIKAPENPVNHVEFLMCNNGNDLKAIEKKYWQQLQKNMACLAKLLNCNVTEVKGIFVSYCPLMRNENLRLKEITVYPDVEFQKELPIRIANAENELKKLIKSVYETNKALSNNQSA